VTITSQFNRLYSKNPDILAISECQAWAQALGKYCTYGYPDPDLDPDGSRWDEVEWVELAWACLAKADGLVEKLDDLGN